MPFNLLLIPAAVVLAIAGFYIGWRIKNSQIQDFVAEAQAQADKIIQNSKQEAETLKKEKIIEGQNDIYQKRQKMENEVRSLRADLNEEEVRLSEREGQLERKIDVLSKKEQNLDSLTYNLVEKESALQNREQRLQKLMDEHNLALEKIAQLSKEEARQRLMDNLISSVKKEAAQTLYDIREEAKETATVKAKEIIVSAIQESATDHSVESTVSIIKLPSDDMKGRIIGREGRNIRAFEITTGVDVIVDDTPEIVILSAFDPVRREVAKIALEKLVADGRIHPARIEDVVAKTWEELDEYMLETGEEVLIELNLLGFSDEIVRHIGKMKYFTSYGQNVLQHSKEVAKLSSLMASELDMDSNLAKRAGLLHDIGKVIQGRLDEDHMVLGSELLKKHKESQAVIDAIAAHHNSETPFSFLSALINAADSISLARPGARKESLESFIKRLSNLEKIAVDFEGVSKVFAIQAGREIRVMVDFEKIDDMMSQQLARDIASRLEKELDYPGQIKVMVIREFRAAGLAK